MTNPLQLVELNQRARTRQQNGLLGTRALVDELRFQALCDLLCETGAVPRQALAGMLAGLAGRLQDLATARSHPQYLLCPDELGYQAHQHRERAAALCGP